LQVARVGVVLPCNPEIDGGQTSILDFEFGGFVVPVRIAQAQVCFLWQSNL